MAALRETGLLDSPPEHAFDRLANLARRVLDVPVCLVSLVDVDRQFFKACPGLPKPWSDHRQTPLSHSFCQHVVAGAAALVVEDARAHPLVRDNLAVRDLGVVGYLGVPLLTPEGQSIGSFCAIDARPRAWTARDVALMQDLAECVMSEVSLRNTTSAALRQSEAELRRRNSDLQAAMAEAETARDRAEKALAELRESKARLEKVLEVETVGVLFWDLATGRLTGANDMFLEMMGYDRADVEAGALSWQTLTPPEFMAATLTEIGTIEASGRIGPYEKEYLRKDGSRQALMFAGSSLGGGRCVEFCVDISARRTAEAALRESEARYRGVFQNAGTGIALVEPSGRFLSCNPAYTTMIGYGEDELRRLNFIELVHPDDREANRVSVEKLLRAEIPQFEIINQSLRKDGATIWVHKHVSLVRDADGRPSCFIVLASDMTERKHAEATKAHLAAIVATSSAAIISKSLDGVVTSWNAAAERIFGYTADEMIGASIRGIIPAHLQAEEDDILARIARGERIQNCETVRLCKDGRAIDASLAVSPILDEGGRIIGASKIVQDITERKRREAQVRLLLKEVNHRAKNLLGVVQAIAWQTAGGGAEAFIERFAARIQALAANQDLLVKSEWRGVELGELLRAQLAQFRTSAAASFWRGAAARVRRGRAMSGHGGARTGDQRREAWRLVQCDRRNLDRVVPCRRRRRSLPHLLA